jgi:hypothetical protein
MTTPALPASLIGKVGDVVSETHDAADLARGLERVFQLELTADEAAYVQDLGRRVIAAILETRPR